MEFIVFHHLKQARGLQDFIHQEGPMKGKMIKNMAYWIRIDNAWWFEFIREDMDQDVFKHNLKAGAVYILDKISEKK